MSTRASTLSTAHGEAAGPPEYTIRPMVEADWPGLLEVEAESFSDDLVEGDKRPYLHRLAGYPPGNWTATRASDGRIVGYLQSHPWGGAEPPHVGGTTPIPSLAESACMWLFDCSLRREARGKGVGQRMVSLCLSHAAEVGCTRVELVAVNGAEVVWSRPEYGAFSPLHVIHPGPDSGYGTQPAVRMGRALGGTAS